MPRTVVYHTDNQWFISNGIQLQEVDFAYILQWQEEGMEIMFESGELFD